MKITAVLGLVLSLTMAAKGFAPLEAVKAGESSALDLRVKSPTTVADETTYAILAE